MWTSVCFILCKLYHDSHIKEIKNHAVKSKGPLRFTCQAPPCMWRESMGYSMWAWQQSHDLNIITSLQIKKLKFRQTKWLCSQRGKTDTLTEELNRETNLTGSIPDYLSWSSSTVASKDRSTFIIQNKVLELSFHFYCWSKNQNIHPQTKGQINPKVNM